MGLECPFVPVDFIEPYLIAVVGVLNHIKPQAPRLVFDRTTGILNQAINVLLFESFFDLDCGDYDIHGTSRSVRLTLTKHVGIVLVPGMKSSIPRHNYVME